jgi:hypothetical protein
MGRGKLPSREASGARPRSELQPERRPDRRQALLNSIDLRIERLPTQEQALRLALEPYGEDFSLVKWNADFESGDVDAINRVHPVTGGFGSIVNNLVEAASAACKLVGVAPATGKRSGLQNSVEALRQQGCFTTRQADLLDQAYTMASMLRHVSPTVDGEALRKEIQQLLKQHRDIVRAFATWLDQHGIAIQAAK